MLVFIIDRSFSIGRRKLRFRVPMSAQRAFAEMNPSVVTLWSKSAASLAERAQSRRPEKCCNSVSVPRTVTSAKRSVASEKSRTFSESTWRGDGGRRTAHPRIAEELIR